MHTTATRLLIGTLLVCMASACTPLRDKQEQVWNTGWSEGDYYAPHQTDL